MVRFDLRYINYFNQRIFNFYFYILYKFCLRVGLVYVFMFKLLLLFKNNFVVIILKNIFFQRR